MAKKATAIDEDEQWKIEGDARTLKEAEMIKADPARLKKASALMEKELNAMANSLEDLAKKRFPNTYKKGDSDK